MSKVKCNEVIFIHVPRTSGSSIKKEIRFHRPEHFSKHITIKRILDKNSWCLNDLRKWKLLSVIRNPFERILSFYMFSIKKGNTKSFENFLKKIYKDNIRDGSTFGMYMPQTCMLTIDGTEYGDINIDHLLRFERIKQDWTMFAKQYNLPKVIKTKHGATRRQHYSLYYNDDLIDIVKDYYRSDLERFNYQYSTK